MEFCASRCLRGIWLLMHLTACMAGMTGRCSLFGRHHIHTFDGVLYEFPGDCSYLLAGDCHRRSFTLLGDFVGGKRTGVTLFLGDVFELHLSVDGLLSQGETRLSLPYASHAVFAGMELGFYKLWSEEFGFTVTIDNAANMALTLTKHHANLTCGLCGNFNSVPADEYTAQEGFLTEDSYDFANSWAVKGAGQACRRVSTRSQSCNSSKDTSEILSSCSVLQTSSVFLHCAHLVSPEVFLSLCQKEVCHCDQADSEDCYCPILLEYARTCHTHGMLLRGWQQESQCFPKCPVGMHYSECTKSCSTTCHNLNIQEVCKEECVDGCTCPVGKVLDGTRCVEVSQCSCVHMGRHFPPGSTISQDCNTCVCRHGSWECTNEGCPGECLVVGQSHFKTFDNKFFTFTGLCQYLLAQDCAEQEFSVIIENVQCADDQDAVCTRSVTLSLEDMTVKLKHGGVVSVNGMDIQTPMHHGRFHIQRSVQTSVLIKDGDGFRLDWDGRGRVLLKLGTQWAGRTCGLCGNYNGNQGDDFLSGSGLVEAAPQTFAQSWRINADCKSTHKPETDPCAINPKRVRFAEEGCAMINSDVFRPCHFLVNPGPFQRFCRYDVCSCVDGEECLCSALASYSAACAAKGVLLYWRSPSLCEMQCPKDKVYEVCGSLCERTCRSLSGVEAGCDGERVCEEGCFCPAGKYLSDSGECVTADKCTCLHDGQLYQPNDVYADHDSICYCERGSMRCSATKMSTSLSDLFYDDDPVPYRERRSPHCVPPMIRAKCDAGEKGLECARNCRNVDLPCFSQLCIPGCFCPPGTVYHLRECIVPEQCPCYLNNKPYRSGQTILVDCNTCVCENRKWSCTNKFCDGICRAVGEGHYITFDGLKYTFPGLCQYVLVQDMCNGEEGSFRVLVENEACGIVGHRCTKSVSVYYHGGLIVMQNGEVKMKVPVPQSAQVEIVRSGQFYNLLLGKHISLSWDKGAHLLVHISATYKSRVCGLCGNFDGNVNNDFVSSNNQMEVDSSHFGNSWKVSPSCADVTQVPAPCGDNIVRMVTVEQSCHVLTGTLFKECNSQVSVEPYLEMCVEAACSCPSVGDCACFCDVIAAYAQACSERGVSVSWRSNELCPMSCEGLNPKSPTSGEELCQWRYNTCGPACPITCQHPEPLQCFLTCVEGCHAYCPPGQLLDEVAMRCVDPSECQVCIHEGHKISHGNKVIISRHDPARCKICHCDNNTLACKACNAATIAPLTVPSPTITSLPMTTMIPEETCDRAMDLAFLLDASAALSESEFEATKNFILGVIERFRMGSAHTRATVLLYQSGVKTSDLQVQKWLFKKIVHELHYIGGYAAFLDEALKYLAYNIYDKNKREHTGRVAVILTASTSPRSLRAYIRMLRKEKITTLTVALGPGVNMTQINDITKVNPDNRAYVLSSTAELPDRLLEVTDYLCTLGLDPKTTPEISSTTTTTYPPHREAIPTKHLSTTTTTPSMPPSKEVTFIIEGSDSVGEANFKKSLLFLEDVITQMAEREEFIRITVIQYSITVTVEIRRWDLRYQRMLLLQRLRQIRWRGGNKTNTGTALATSFQETASVPPSSHGPTPPQLVFLVTENPPTDTVTRPPSTSTQRHVYPIGVGPKVREFDLFQISSPQRPIMVEDYNHLTRIIHRVVNITHNTVTPHFPTLPPVAQPTLPSVSPTKEVIFIIEGSDSVGEANFKKSLLFLEDVITQMAEREEFIRITVIQYSITVTVEIRRWDLRYQRMLLLQRLRQIRWRGGNKTNTGTALATSFQETASVPPSSHGPTPPQLVFLVTENPPTDTVTRPPSTSTQRHVYPIGVGPKVREFDLFQISSPQRPIMVEDYNHLTRIIHRVVNITHNTVTPHFPTLPPVAQPTLPSVSPTKEVIFIIEGSDSVGEANFKKSLLFLEDVITQMAEREEFIRITVIQYSITVTVEIRRWDLRYQRMLLLQRLRQIRWRGGNKTNTGTALATSFQETASVPPSSHGPTPPQLVFLVTENPPTDTVTRPPSTSTQRHVYPIGVGPKVREFDLFQISSPQRPIMVEDYNHLTRIIHRVVNITHNTVTPHFPTLPPVAQPTLPSVSPTKEVIFIIEGSDSVGEANFKKSLLFLEDVITQMAEREEFIRITVIQYSITVTVEIRRWDLRYQRMLLLQRLRQIRWRGGNKTNTGTALATTFQETASVPPSSHGPTPPQLVFLVTENPPTDTVTRPPSTSTQRHVYPIGVGPKVREFDLFQISSPQRPIMVEDYNHLTRIVHRVVNITHNTVTPHFPTLPPLAQPTLSSLPPTVPCKTPVDVLFLLKAGEQFDDMKSFVKAFIKTADTGLKGTQVSVIQYGDTTTMEFTWKEDQSKSHLLSLVDDIPKRRTATPALGSVLQYAVQAAIRGGRVGVAKAVVMIVTDKSTDQVREAANEALAAGVSVFPIGVGQDYDQNELVIMGHKQDNSLHLKSMDQLRMLLTLDQGYTERICRAGPPGVCVDDSGMERKPGESWMLEDGCHSVLCHPSGAVTMQSHKVSCDKLEPPACRSNMPPVKVQEACSCHWECPCICMGSSTNHVVRFDSLPLRLDAEGLCSYTLLTVSRGVTEGSEVILHNGPCQGSAHYNQVCMKAIEVMHGQHRLLLKDDMMALIGQDELSLPWRYAGLELVRYGGMMMQLKSDHGYILTFTPQSNEFTITLLTSSIRGRTAGLCGACGDESISVLSLRNGSSTADQQTFVSDWTMAGDGAVCLPKRKAVCATGAAMGCQALRSEVFQPCHAHIPVLVFLAKCEEQACEESDVCELISAYALMCRQMGVCLDWRSPHLCPLHCPASMEYDACRTGCIEDCESMQTLRGDWSVARGNQSSCTDTPSEGCFCTRGTVLHQGACVSPEACKQCVDHHGRAYQYLQSWVPDDNPCLICMCLDRQHVNCTARPCNDVKAPICGPCEVLKEKRDSKCCPEYECVCDLLSCEVPEAPRCEDGEVVVLKNPGECQPIHECVCKKEDCAPLFPPECGAHRQPTVKKTKCCDVFECSCNCHNSTRTCSPGFITASTTNDCGCTETSCLPDKVCVVGGVVHPVGSKWDEGCEKCSCSHLQDTDTSLHTAHCSPPVCEHNCPMGSTYTPASGKCCGECRPTNCVESEGVMRGDTLIGGKLRNVGEQWQSPYDKCVLQQCVRVKDELFISSTNISCSVMNTPSCPLGSELRCDTHDCCPRCHCAPLDACVLNNTLIGAGEKLMVDTCTHCECMVEDGAIKKYRLSCRRTPCTACPLGYIEQKEEGACCGRCVATTCFVGMPDGQQMSLQVNTTRDDGCNQYTCGVNNKGDLALQIRTTTCAPFNRQECLEHGGTISQIGTTCCEMCTESACRRTAGTLNYVKVEDCQSEQQIELHYCEGKCRSKSMYSLQSAAVEQECVCCVATGTEPLSVPILCTNGTRSHHTVLSVTACDCQFKHCT
ncbi:von Willebrand factor isoform X2 [Dunckerocampus dactyliophorus]|uniref:von Willebrand factor isoform X2 n=1 Tax=Dunckerocampus dactyliophorus TaxID=161453 RepID=UPI0024070D3B|nr:von Willebrand factor isoform X2 [Dunckerocampus dactyliophorus]